MKKSREFFKANPRVDIFHTTEDGAHFANAANAQVHAAALRQAGKGKGMVTPITRAQAESEEPEATADQGAEGKSDNGQPATDDRKPNLGLLKGAVTRAQNAVDKVKDGGDEAAIAAANDKLAAAQKAYADAGGA